MSRRPAAVAGAALAVLVTAVGPALLAGAAFAAAPPTTTPPTGAATITFYEPNPDGATFTQAPVSLAGQVSRNAGYIDSVQVVVKWTDTAQRPPAPHPSQQTTITPPTRGPTYNWSFGPNLPANGHYSVTVVATTEDASGAQGQNTATRAFVLNVAPAAPDNVTATIDQSRRVTNLTWSPNSEQDLLGYQVNRAGPAAGDAGHLVASVPATQSSFSDTEVAQEPAGTYRYTVVAVRQTGSGSGSLDSKPSSQAAATYSTPPQTNPPPAPPSSGGSGGHGSTGGSSGGSTVYIPPPTNNDLSTFHALVGQVQAQTAPPPVTAEPDGAYNPKLPYQPQTSGQVVTVPGSLASPTLGAADTSTSPNRLFEILAGALMLAVLAMFAMVLRRSADQAVALEAVAVGPVPFGAVAGFGGGHDRPAAVPAPAVPAPAGPAAPAPAAAAAAGATAADDDWVATPLMLHLEPPAAPLKPARTSRRRSRVPSPVAATDGRPEGPALDGDALDATGDALFDARMDPFAPGFADLEPDGPVTAARPPRRRSTRPAGAATPARAPRTRPGTKAG